jgi:hypothetical protein
MRALRATVAFLLCALAPFASSQRGSAPIKVPQVLHRGFQNSITPYTDRPADLTLTPHGQGARRGDVWIQNVGIGLLVVGRVDGERPDFPRNQNLILAKDHVELWLADGKDPDLPPLGWGNQFDQVALPNGADSCADWATHGASETPAAPAAAGAEKRCRTWAETQARYRPFLKRLFVRQWLVTPDYAVESFATPAFDEIAAHFASDKPDSEEVPTALKPADQLQMWFGHGRDQTGYTFEILIPYTAFPPLSTTNLSDLRLLVDVFNPPPAGNGVVAYSTSSLARIYAKPDTFNALRLDPPQQFQLTPCDMPLAAKDKYGDTHAAWFIPKADPGMGVDSDAFILVNDGSGYQYEPDALSPVARPVHFFWHGIGGSEWVCGPYLSYRNSEQSLSFDLSVDEDGFDARRLPGGDLLIKVGPRVYGSEFGSGTCGACPRTELRILRLGADQRPLQMLRLGGIIDNGAGASQDFALARDWSRIVQYDQPGLDDQGKPGPWSSTAWCRGESTYGQCDHQDNVEPPDPPALKELRNSD